MNKTIVIAIIIALLIGYGLGYSLGAAKMMKVAVDQAFKYIEYKNISMGMDKAEIYTYAQKYILKGGNVNNG